MLKQQSEWGPPLTLDQGKKLWQTRGEFAVSWWRTRPYSYLSDGYVVGATASRLTFREEGGGRIFHVEPRKLFLRKVPVV